MACGLTCGFCIIILKEILNSTKKRARSLKNSRSVSRGGCSTKFCTWRPCPKVQPLVPSYIPFLTEKVPLSYTLYLTIIPRARMGSESIAHEAHEAEGRMVYWLRGHEGERNNWFSKIQLVGRKYRDKTTLASNTFFAAKKTALFATSGL